MVLLTHTPSKGVKSPSQALAKLPTARPRLKPAKRVDRKVRRQYRRLWRFKAFCLGISLPASILGTYVFATEILMPEAEVARSLYEWEMAASEPTPEPDRWQDVEKAVNRAISLTTTAETKSQWRELTYSPPSASLNDGDSEVKQQLLA